VDNGITAQIELFHCMARNVFSYLCLTTTTVTSTMFEDNTLFCKDVFF